MLFSMPPLRSTICDGEPGGNTRLVLPPWNLPGNGCFWVRAAGTQPLHPEP